MKNLILIAAVLGLGSGAVHASTIGFQFSGSCHITASCVGVANATLFIDGGYTFGTPLSFSDIIRLEYSSSSQNVLFDSNVDTLTWITGSFSGTENSQLLSFGMNWIGGMQFGTSGSGADTCGIGYTPTWCLRSPSIIGEDWGTTSGTWTVVPTVVPIPAAVWLFVFGLGLLGWVKRRQIA